MINETQSRKEFLRNLGIVGALVISIGVFLKNILVFIFPDKLEKKYHKYLVAKVSDIPLGKAKEISIQGKPVFIVHLDDGFKAFSGICTHLGCIIKWEDNKQRFYCPCHKGIFAKTGEVTGGPPPEPLDQFTITREKNLVYIQVEDKYKGPWV